MKGSNNTNIDATNTFNVMVELFKEMILLIKYQHNVRQIWDYMKSACIW